jgi:IK cytokine
MDRKIILDFDRKQKSRKHKHKQSSTHKKHKQESKQEEPSTSAYRDRAQERREGINKDFELDPDDLIISNPIVDGDQAIDESERRRQQIEESKYLGGDVEHTHLVKGLDFALLEKIKASEKLELEKNQRNHDLNRDLLLGASDSDDEEFTKEALLATSATTSNKRQIDLGKLKTSEIIPCRTALARRILNALEEKWPDKSELFLPGRMSYVVPIDEESDAPVTTIIRSRAEQQESETSNEKDLAFDQLINIFSKIRKKV